MKIFFITFTFVIIFIGGIKLFTGIIEEKNTTIPIMIERWDIKNNKLEIELSFQVDEPMFLNKNLICQLFDKKKKRLGFVKKRLQGDLKKSLTQTIIIGKVPKKTEFIDCSFIDIDESVDNEVN